MKTFIPGPYQLTHPLEFREALIIKDQINENGKRNVARLQEFAFYYYITPEFKFVTVKEKGFAVMITGQYWKDCKDWVCNKCKFKIMYKKE